MSPILKLSLVSAMQAAIVLQGPLAFAGNKYSSTPATSVGSKKFTKCDTVDTAVSAGTFQTLAAALKQTGLLGTLNGQGPSTVFAPTDEAFTKLPPGTLEALLQDKDKLTAILTYQVAPGKVKAAGVVRHNSAKTVPGQSVFIDAAAGVKVKDAKEVKADTDCSNCVIHVIDSVLVLKE